MTEPPEPPAGPRSAVRSKSSLHDGYRDPHLSTFRRQAAARPAPPTPGGVAHDGRRRTRGRLDGDCAPG